MARGRHAPAPIVQVLDATVLTLNAIAIVSAITIIILMFITFSSDGSIQGLELIALAGALVLILLLAAAEYGIRKIISKMGRLGNGKRVHKR